MKIVAVTPIWNSSHSDAKATKVINHFVESWVSDGHEVVVVHLYTSFPRLYYLLIRPVKGILETIVGHAISTASFLPFAVESPGLTVLNFPVAKVLPNTAPGQSTMNKLNRKVVQSLRSLGFAPDVILGHWLLPSLEAVAFLKEEFPSAKSAITLHVGPRKYRKFFEKSRFQEAFKAVDRIGFRSHWIKNQLEEFGSHSLHGRQLFHCPSGVSNEFLTPVNFRECIHKLELIFVGTLYRRKHVLAILEAMRLSELRDEISLKVIGDGEEMPKLKDYVQSHDLRVEFAGWLPRSEIIRALDESEVFVMVSERETFGLVYLEAMARGKMVVASRGEGVDGIITHGVNGFLSSPGDSTELATLFGHIFALSPSERRECKNNARATAERLAADKVAKNYLDKLKPQ